MLVNKEILNNEFEEMELEKKWEIIKKLTNACVGVGTVRVIQIAMPTIAKGVVSAKAIVTGSYIIGGLVIPNYFVGALILGASTPAITEFIKTYKLHKQRKAEQISNKECFKLED